MKDEEIAMLALWNDSESSNHLSVSAENGKSIAMSKRILENKIHNAIAFIFEKNIDKFTDNPFIGALIRREVMEKRFISYLSIIHEYLTAGIRIITYWDEEYPDILRNTPNPPYILYVHGNTFPGRNPIAIVGSRGASKGGLDRTYHLALDLAERGRTIVSGLALGVDTKAHEGALDGNGNTIAVLAGDVRRIYPPENTILAKRIMEKGAIVSEVTRYAEVSRAHFVSRNRITSGLSECVIIGESGKAGGTLHQARFAIAQKRPLFILYKDNFEETQLEDGYNRLVEMGAIPIHSAEDIYLQGTQSKLF